MSKKEVKETQQLIAAMSGYKATDSQMCCKGFQFELGVWYDLPSDKPLVHCSWGFHFCEQPSGVYAYYSGLGTRVFLIEAEQVLECEKESGSDFKRVARRIRLVKEITPGLKEGETQDPSNTGDRNTGDQNTGNRNTGNRNTGHGNAGDQNTGNQNTGDQNTGDQNTGDWNTGNWNTGNWNTGNRNTGNWNTGNRNTGNWNTGNRNTGNRNTGDWNTGYRNTGDWNTGYQNTGDRNTGNQNTGDRNTGNRNTGDQNTGYRNTGDWNTGYRNTGDWNTGNQNTGDRNTGYQNTGDWNTGHGNATNRSAGFFCIESQTVKCFDIETGLTYDGFIAKYSNYCDLCLAIHQPEAIEFETYKNLPGITPEKLKALHAKHLAAKAAKPSFTMEGN